MAMEEPHFGYLTANVSRCCDFIRDKTGASVEDFIRTYVDSQGDDEFFCIEATVDGILVGFAIPLEVADARDLFRRISFRKIVS